MEKINTGPEEETRYDSYPEAGMTLKAFMEFECRSHGHMKLLFT